MLISLHKVSIRDYIMTYSIDWLKTNQDHGIELPPISEWKLPDNVDIDSWTKTSAITGELKSQGNSPIRHEGSYSTSIVIRVRGTAIEFDGNVSRYGRLDNLEGLHSLDSAFTAVNKILTDLHPDLPHFTKATDYWYSQNPKQKKPSIITNGANILRVDYARNSSVGKGNVKDYLASHAMLPFKNMRPFLYPDGTTIDWQNPNKSRCEEGGNYTYPNIYDKANELTLHALPKITKMFPPIYDHVNKCSYDSPEVKYLKNLIEFAREYGVARHEVKFKRQYLENNGLRHYGLFDEIELIKYCNEFVDLDKKAGGVAMKYETLYEKLVNSGACDSSRQASTTMGYYDAWRAGRPFDCSVRSLKTHRARLRKVGIDIAIPYDQSKVVDLFVKEQRQIIRTPIQAPDFYRHHELNRLRAV